MAPMIRNNQNGTQTGNLFDRSCYTKDGRCGNGKSVDADADVDVERRDAELRRILRRLLLRRRRQRQHQRRGFHSLYIFFHSFL